MQKKAAPENNPDQILYAELGAGGGRKGQNLNQWNLVMFR